MIHFVINYYTISLLDLWAFFIFRVQFATQSSESAGDKILATIENVIIVHNRRRRAKRDLATLNTFFFLRCVGYFDNVIRHHHHLADVAASQNVTLFSTIQIPPQFIFVRLSTFSLNVMKSPTRAHPFVELFLRVKCVQFAGECGATSRAQKFNNSSRKDFIMKLWEIACRLAEQKGKQIFFVAQSARPSRLWLIALFTVRFWQAERRFPYECEILQTLFISDDVRQLQTAEKLCN